MKKVFAIAFVCLTTHCLVTRVDAQAITGLWVFGDSLSDQGNVLAGTGVVPWTPPYFDGRFSNGPVWIKHLADGLGVPVPTASLQGGSNFAWGGAQTGPGESTLGPVPHVGAQISAFQETGATIESTDLVVVWAGYNDLSGDIEPDVVGNNLSGHITVLHELGARNFLIPNLLTSPARSDELNAIYAQEIGQLKGELTGNFVLFDAAALEREIISDLGGFGFMHGLNEPACSDCGAGVGGVAPPMVIAENPDAFLFWDDIHPSAAYHEIIGARALAAVVNIPEPSSSVLGICGVLGVFYCAIRRRLK